MKKLASRGFTLVELMIVIAIIGILAAVLYPALTGYFERSRDTNRQGGIRNITLALSQYQTDNAKYPAKSTDANALCTDVLNEPLKTYMTKVSEDPKGNFGITGCTAKWGYGYSLIKDRSGTADSAYILAAKMETKGNANFNGSKWTDSDIANFTLGKGYIANANNKGWIPKEDEADDTANVTAENAYYIVTQ